MQTRPYLLITIMTFLVESGWCQLNNRAFEDRQTLEVPDSGKLFAGANALGFIKNNEYKQTIINGYTLFGFQFQPYLSYQISKSVP